MPIVQCPTCERCKVRETEARWTWRGRKWRIIMHRCAVTGRYVELTDACHVTPETCRELAARFDAVRIAKVGSDED